jgi:hypothetical protein
VLFVFAIAIAGDEAMSAPVVVPRPVSWGLVLLLVGLLSWFSWSWSGGERLVAEGSFTEELWRSRALDVLVQVVLIFSGVLAVLGILTKEVMVRAKRQAAAGPSIPVTTIRPIGRPPAAYGSPLDGPQEVEPEEVLA